MRTFFEMGEEAGDTIAYAITLIDGLVVIGGGFTNASKYFMPLLMNELNGTIGKLNGEIFSRLQMKAYNLDDELNMANYESAKRIGVAVSKLGVGRALP